MASKEISQLVSEEFNVNPEQAEADALEFPNRLLENGFIHG